MSLLTPVTRLSWKNFGGFKNSSVCILEESQSCNSPPRTLRSRRLASPSTKGRAASESFFKLQTRSRGWREITTLFEYGLPRGSWGKQK